MTLNPLETLNTFDPDLSKELRNRGFSKNLVRMNAPFLRFTTAAYMPDAVEGTLLFPEEYKGHAFFTVGMHGYDLVDYSTSDIYGTQAENGLVVGTTYGLLPGGSGKQKIVYTHTGGQFTRRAANPSFQGVGQEGRAQTLGAVIITGGRTSNRNYPPPGVVNARVERNRSGNILKISVEVHCYTQEQLQVLDSLCFVPGMTCILEWGTQYTTSQGPKNINPKLDFTKPSVLADIDAAVKESRLSFINKWCKPNKFNYDWGVATIANIKTVLENNIYKTTITAIGRADNIMYISAYATTNTLTNAALNANINTPTSINEYFRYQGEFSNRIEKMATGEVQLPERYKDKILKFSDGAAKSQTFNISVGSSFGGVNDIGLEDAYFMTFDFFIDVVLNGVPDGNGVVNLINKGLADKAKLTKLLASLTNNPAEPNKPESDTIFVGYNKDLRSTSSETMIIYNERAINAAKNNNGLTGVKNDIVSLLKKNEREGGPKVEDTALDASEQASVKDKLSKSKFGEEITTTSGTTPLFKGVWINSKAVQQAMYNARTFMEGMEVVLRNVNAATENYWNLKIYFDDDLQLFRIFDDNVTKPDFNENKKIYEFNKLTQSATTDSGTVDILGPDVLDVELTTDFPKLLFAQLAISGLNGGVLSSDPSRKDLDFIRQTAVRDVFNLSPTTVSGTGTSSDSQLRRSSQNVLISAFANSLYGASETLNGLRKRDFVSQLQSQFKTEMPSNVADLVRRVFLTKALLSVEEGSRYRTQLKQLQELGEITLAQFDVLRQLFASRAIAVINQYKALENKYLNSALIEWSRRAPGRNTTGRMTEVEKKIEENKNELIKVIRDAAGIQR